MAEIVLPSEAEAAIAPLLEDAGKAEVKRAGSLFGE